jgi:hypothetical protein
MLLAVHLFAILTLLVVWLRLNAQVWVSAQYLLQLRAANQSCDFLRTQWRYTAAAEKQALDERDAYRKTAEMGRALAELVLARR